MFTSLIALLLKIAVLKVPGVKKALCIPKLPDAAPISSPQSPFSVFPALKQATSATNAPKLLPVEPSKHQKKKTSSSDVSQSSLPVESSKHPKKKTSSDVRQRLRRLEKQVKGRKKNKNWGKN